MARNLLGIRHLSPEDIQELLKLSSDFKKRTLEGRDVPNLANRVVGMLFFENSTRTRVSFEQAAHYLRMKTANFASGGSSMAKGETFKDTILTLRYERLEGLVIRHRMSGSAALAARYFGGPVLNAGDGQHEHPTQALGDALTIMERKGDFKGLQVAIVGDVEHSRVARSNAWLLSKMGAEVRFVGPRTLMPSHMQMLPGEVHYNLREGIEGADVIICLRLQRERMHDGMLSSITEYANMYQINRDSLKWVNRDCIVMHPGPINRGVEVDDLAADGDRSVITDQIENGIFVRMAALHWVFTSDAKPKVESPPKSEDASMAKSKSDTGTRAAAGGKKK
jgi:aspartate carbamoyltransferase catalytic subunit